MVIATLSLLDLFLEQTNHILMNINASEDYFVEKRRYSPYYIIGPIFKSTILKTAKEEEGMFNSLSV